MNMGNLPGRNLHSQVASGHHDPVGLLDDPVDIVHAFLTLYLGYDINMIPAVCLKQLTDFFDSLCVSHKRSRDKIHALLDSKQNILHILLRDIGKADAGIRYVDALLLSQFTAVDHHAGNIRICFGDNLQFDQSVID